MTGKPTEKMVWRLLHAGYNPDKIDAMSYEQASDIIGKLPPFVKGVEKAVKPLDTAYVGYQKSSIERPKPSYNPSSQYVSYAKDVFLALREMVHVEVMKPNSKMEIVADEQIMARAVQLVKLAIKEFE